MEGSKAPSEIDYFGMYETGESSSKASAEEADVVMQNKIKVFSTLVQNLNELYAQADISHIDLLKKEFEPRKDALAFFVESNYQLSPETWKDQIEMLTLQIKQQLHDLGTEKAKGDASDDVSESYNDTGTVYIDPDEEDSVPSSTKTLISTLELCKDVNWRLHSTISELYQLSLETMSMGAEMDGNDELTGRITEMQDDWKQLEPLKELIRKFNKSPVSFGGIKHSMLPNWYKEEFINTSLYEAESSTDGDSLIEEEPPSYLDQGYKEDGPDSNFTERSPDQD